MELKKKKLTPKKKFYWEYDEDGDHKFAPSSSLAGEHKIRLQKEHAHKLKKQ
jgi:hypothetical protein